MGAQGVFRVKCRRSSATTLKHFPHCSQDLSLYIVPCNNVYFRVQEYTMTCKNVYKGAWALLGVVYVDNSDYLTPI